MFKKQAFFRKNTSSAAESQGNSAMHVQGGSALKAIVRSKAVLAVLSLVFVAAFMVAMGITTAYGASEAPSINDVDIRYKDTDTILGSYSSPNVATGSITSKGGILELDSMIWWTDWSHNRNSSYVTWASSNPEIATVVGGVVTAKADGTVQISCTTTNGLEATCQVKVTGQTNAPYVTNIRILDENGTPLQTAVIEDDFATAYKVFYAEVTLHDPATDETYTLSTMNGTLNKQTNGKVSDIKWYVGDTAVGTVDEDMGWYRPSRYGMVSLYAYSTAGHAGTTVRAKINVATNDPLAGATEDDYIPQDKITIKAYYELYTPEEHGDEAYVINKEYTVDELTALGITTSVYTSFGTGNYWTITGQGVLLRSVLADAGITDLAGVTYFKFGTADAIDRPVSAAYVFNPNRCYYPNIDIGSYAEAQRVEPMLAFKSIDVRNESTEPDNDGMVENTRFRLLFGATPEGGNSSYQIKWINTLYVELAGAPSYSDGDGGGTGTGSGSGDSETSGTAGVVGGNSGDSDGPTGTAGSAYQIESESAALGDGTSGTGRKFSIYQMMNKHDAQTQTTIEPSPIFEMLVFPLGIVILVLGMVQTVRWFRRETSIVSLAPPKTCESSK